MNLIQSSTILFIFKAVNRFFRPKNIFVFLIFAIFAFSNKANAVVVVIEGGSSFVCPKGTYTYIAKTKTSKPSIILFKVEIFDRTEKLVSTGKSVENKVYLDTKGLQPGTYFLHIYSGDQVLREQIIIEN